MAGHAVNPSLGLGHGIHAVDGPAICARPTFDSFPVTVGESIGY